MPLIFAKPFKIKNQKTNTLIFLNQINKYRSIKNNFIYLEYDILKNTKSINNLDFIEIYNILKYVNFEYYEIILIIFSIFS